MSDSYIRWPSTYTTPSPTLNPPAVTTAERDAIVNPPTGGLIYNTDAEKLQEAVNALATLTLQETITYYAVPLGAAGNGITISYAVGLTLPPVVSVVGTDITVTFPAGTIAHWVVNAVNADPAASALVHAVMEGDEAVHPPASGTLSGGVTWADVSPPLSPTAITGHLEAATPATYNIGANDSMNPADPDLRYKKAFLKEALIIGSADGLPPYGLNNPLVVGMAAIGSLANTSVLVGSNSTFFNSTAMGFMAFTKDGGASNAPGFFNTNSGADLDVVFGIGHFSSALTELVRFTASGDVLAQGKLGVGNSAAATTPGTVVKKIEIFDAAGVSLGFIPVYDSIS